MSIENNPFINSPKLKHGAVPFDKIKLEHYLPAFEYAIKEADNKLEAIKKNPDTPSFENTALPIETCGELMWFIEQTFINLMNAESDNKFKELAQELSPMLSTFENNTLLDSTLFKRIKHVYVNMKSENINVEQKQLVLEMFKNFTLNGTLLNDSDKKKVRKINEELSKLASKYIQNTLNAKN